MKQSVKQLIIQIPFTVSLYMFLRKMYALPFYIADGVKFWSKRDQRFSFRVKDLHPCLIDKTATTHFEPHYTYHPAWAARKVADLKPDYHVDIASTLQFPAIVSAFVPVKFYDYRPAMLNLDGLTSEHADLTQLHFADDSIESLSCMHTLEHIGLGRYGDPIDPSGDKKAASELARVLKPGGQFIFVTPVGEPKIAFNAHRIYSYQQVLDLFPNLKLKEFSLVPDDFKQFGLIKNADPELVKNQSWACGCFLFTK